MGCLAFQFRSPNIEKSPNFPIRQNPTEKTANTYGLGNILIIIILCSCMIYIRQKVMMHHICYSNATAYSQLCPHIALSL
jgi:hypothetical protein